MGRQSKTQEDQSEWPASGQPLRMAIARTSVAFWRKKVFKPMGRGGVESPHYSARIGHLKRRERFPLFTPNKEAAATKAAQIFSYLLEHGWEPTLEKYKPQRVQPAPVIENTKASTVGGLIEASRKFSTAREKSLNTYIKAFRRIVSSIMKIDHPSRKSRTANRGQTWQEQVDSVALADLTPQRIQSWKKQFLNTPRENAQLQKQAITTLNSLIRNSKALFAKKLLPFLEQEVELPSPLPFDQVTMEKSPSVRYKSKIDAKVILKNSSHELKETNPESYKILLLALVCGLRVSEIDHLLWQAFDFNNNILLIEDSKYHRLKSEDSAGEIALSNEISRVFKEYSQSSKGQFVIAENLSAQTSVTTSSYRCQKHINVLKTWLRDQGIEATKPIHELRKEVGSIIASEEGIFAASRYLRHSDIRITSSIYADQKNRITPSIAQDL